MTKCIVLGEQPKEENKKPIELVKSISEYGVINYTIISANDYENIELIKKGHGEELCFMFAYNTGRRKHGVLYLGHWNDGVV